jgi:nifR3 family TIM-barrel protein
MWLTELFKKKLVVTQPINKGFWATLEKPIFVLAPMADVTDCAFRKLIAKYGKPDVMWTEFVSADGLASRGREALLIDLKFSEAERPIVAQLFGSSPENMEAAAKLCQELGFDGIDINMGCPDRSIEKSKSGAYCIRDPKLAKSIVEAARRGAPHLPVSVKTRIGYNSVEWGWVREVLSWGLPAVTFHLRTRKEMSLVPAHWDLMSEILKIRNEISPDTIVLGNGDVANVEDARMKCKDSGCDGVMIGRGIFGTPWLFDKEAQEKRVPEKLKIMLEHTKLFLDMLGSYKNFAIMKKHYKAYVNGFPGAKELRVELMEAKTYEEIERLTKDFLEDFNGGEIS